VGSSLSSLLGQFTNAPASNSGGLMGLAHSAGSGALAGSAAGPWGAAAGAAVGAISHFMGGNPRVPFGAASNGLAPHSPDQSRYLDMTNWAQDNGNEYARWALENGCYVEDIELMNYNARTATGNSWQDAVVWWRSHPQDLENDLTRAGLRFKVSAGASPAAGSGGGLLNSPGAAMNGYAPGGGGLPAGAQGLSAGGYLQQILQGALSGAQTGAGNAAGQTPLGQQVKKDSINQFIKDYQLPLGAALGGLGYLVYKAFVARR
jgi:hypothetical protein